MQKVRLFAKCFKTERNCRVRINLNFKLDFFPKVLTILLKLPVLSHCQSCTFDEYRQDVSAAYTMEDLESLL